MRWAKLVARMECIEDFGGNAGRKETTRCADNVKIDFRKIGFGCME
jgi:hypothetical protein